MQHSKRRLRDNLRKLAGRSRRLAKAVVHLPAAWRAAERARRGLLEDELRLARSASELARPIARLFEAYNVDGIIAAHLTVESARWPDAVAVTIGDIANACVGKRYRHPERIRANLVRSIMATCWTGPSQFPARVFKRNNVKALLEQEGVLEFLESSLLVPRGTHFASVERIQPDQLPLPYVPFGRLVMLRVLKERADKLFESDDQDAIVALARAIADEFGGSATEHLIRATAPLSCDIRQWLDIGDMDEFRSKLLTKRAKAASPMQAASIAAESFRSGSSDASPHLSRFANSKFGRLALTCAADDLLSRGAYHAALGLASEAEAAGDHPDPRALRLEAALRSGEDSKMGEVPVALLSTLSNRRLVGLAGALVECGGNVRDQISALLEIELRGISLPGIRPEAVARLLREGKMPHDLVHAAEKGLKAVPPGRLSLLVLSANDLAHDRPDAALARLEEALQNLCTQPGVMPGFTRPIAARTLAVIAAVMVRSVDLLEDRDQLEQAKRLLNQAIAATDHLVGMRVTKGDSPWLASAAENLAALDLILNNGQNLDRLLASYCKDDEAVGAARLRLLQFLALYDTGFSSGSVRSFAARLGKAEGVFGEGDFFRDLVQLAGFTMPDLVSRLSSPDGTTPGEDALLSLVGATAEKASLESLQMSRTDQDKAVDRSLAVALALPTDDFSDTPAGASLLKAALEAALLPDGEPVLVNARQRAVAQMLLPLCIAFDCATKARWDAARRFLSVSPPASPFPLLQKALGLLCKDEIAVEGGVLALLVELHESMSAQQRDAMLEHIMRAFALIGSGNHLDALSALDELDRFGMRTKLLPLRLKCLLEQGDSASAWPLIEEMMASKHPETAARYLRRIDPEQLVPACMEGVGKGGEETLERLARHLDWPVWLLTLLHDHLVGETEIERAAPLREKLLRKQIAAGRAPFDAHLRLSNSLLQAGAPEEADAIIVAASEIWPHLRPLWRQRFNIALLSGNLARVKEDLIEAIGKVSRPHAIGMVRTALNHLDFDITSCIAAHYPQLTNSDGYRIAVARHMIESGRLDAVEEFLAPLPQGRGRGLLEAALKLGQGDRASARSQLKALLDDNKLDLPQLIEARGIAEKLRDMELVKQVGSQIGDRFVAHPNAELVGRQLVELGEEELGMHILRAALDDPRQREQAGWRLAHYLLAGGQFEEAETIFKQLHVEFPENSKLLYDWAELKLEANQPDAAVRLARLGRYHALGEDAEFNVAEVTALFDQGKLDEGWRIYQKLPLHLTGRRYLGDRFTTDFDRWKQGERPLLCTRAGVGDEIRWVSVYRDITAATEGRARITCDPRLETLLARSFPEITFVPTRRCFRATDPAGREHSDLPHPSLRFMYDNHGWAAALNADTVSTVMDALVALRGTRESFAQPMPVLKADPHKVTYWRKRLGERNRPNIGIAWRSDLASYKRDKHYLPQEAAYRLLSSIDANWYILQNNIVQEERDAILAATDGNAFFVSDTDDIRNDFELMAGLLTALDIVMAAGTATLELAGTLGVPTIVISRSRLIDWRQQPDGTDLWFPNMRHAFAPFGSDSNGILLARRISSLVAA